MRIVLFLGMIICLSGCALELQGSPPDADILITDTPVIEATNQPSLELLCQQKGYTWNAADSTCSYTQDGNPIIEIFYPIELVYDPLIDPAMESYINNYRADFDARFAQSGANSPGAWRLTLSYTIYQHSETIVSIEWAESYYTGGANVGFEYSTFTFDRSSGQLIEIADLFAEGFDPLTTLQQPVRDELNIMLADNSTTTAINNGTDELSDFSHFVLTETELIILFEPYTVAPGAAGAQRVSLPLSDYQTTLNPQFR